MTRTDRHSDRRAHGQRIALAAGLVLLGAVALLWAWNTLAADLLALPPARFKHALAAELMLAVLVALSAGVARLVLVRGDTAG